MFSQMELLDVYIYIGPEISSVIFMSAFLIELLAKEEFTVDQFYLVGAQPVTNSSSLLSTRNTGKSKMEDKTVCLKSSVVPQGNRDDDALSA